MSREEVLWTRRQHVRWVLISEQPLGFATKERLVQLEARLTRMIGVAANG